jgi:hypothetical protein
MVPWLVLAGIILAPSAAFFLWSWRTQRNDMALMRATETTRAGDVAKLAAGSLVEVKGRLRVRGQGVARGRDHRGDRSGRPPRWPRR